MTRWTVLAAAALLWSPSASAVTPPAYPRAAPPVPAAPGATSGAPAVSDAPGARVDRPVRDPRLTEMSGLAVSPEYPGVLWTHNDSGNPPVVYALGPDGAVVAAVRVRAVADEDWEAIATYRDADGRAMIAVGDVGDNLARRAGVQVVLLEEPPLRDATVTPRRVLRLRYPDGATDAETLLVDPEAGRMYVVTKGLGGAVYQVPTDVWPGSAHRTPRDEGTLVRIASVPLVLVTDGVMGPGHHPVLRTYGEIAVLPTITDDVVGGTLEPLAIAPLPAQRQGEGVTFDRGDALLSSEGVGQPILRLPLPAALAAALGGTPAGGGDRPGAASAAPTSRPPASPTSALARLTSWPVLATVALLAATTGGLVGRRRRHRTPRRS
ncbi:MAG TPA: hypothetical protein VI248_18895 [Kineosporiaceae bacterium]